MEVTLRQATVADIPTLARIFAEAFRSIDEPHGFFFPDLVSVEAGTQMITSGVSNPGIYGVVAESGGQILGSNFMDERDAVRGIGPISVDPKVQNRGLGRRLMQAVLERARGAVSVRLVQEAFHMRSMSLYATLGFDVKEPLLLITGRPKSGPVVGVEVRRLAAEDVEECAALCRRVHRFDRANQVRDASAAFVPFVALRGGRIVAYATEPTHPFIGHGVAETEADMKALLLGVAALRPAPIRMLLPTRQASLFRWLLAEGLRSMSPMTLMSIGEYQEPRGCWFPSILY